ncbi:AfsR/SARP family transcriptional regulator [Streptomyces tauricus]|uniref:AfsR/SARP family transcriptional regulator n=1 Tax=Streptomyces tauricus TaxID=68274 RepID=UPI0022445DB5|nr:AfsR/SARP family transcriptional regulator [Streptomyces tauricus]MCW8103326.1 BTAD domain-containing putative transcriptional regulator [Streptomyces tauricus]
MEQRLRFSVLGPLRTWLDGVEIELGPPQQRAVLAVLLLAEGAQVSVDQLADAVWGTEAPASASGILRGYVHRLRRALDPEADVAASVIRSLGDGYQLRTVGELDLSLFRELCAQAERAQARGETESAVTHLREALSLWQGSALAGVPGEYAQGQRHRLDELRLSARSACLRAELDLGSHVAAVAELVELVAEHPLDERLRELLMLALYRSGRQAAALDSYRAAQGLLANELGVDPGPALQTLYQRVLRADPELLAPPDPVTPAPPTPSPTPAIPHGSPVPAQLPSGLPVFVGRDAELAEMARLSSGGTVVVSAIAGMAGVGKTAFAVHWARQVAARFPDGQLYLNLRGFDPVTQPVAPEHALRTLLGSLGEDLRGLQQDLDALSVRYRTLISGKRMLVLLDNARDAAQVRPLLPGTADSLAIVTSRNRLTGLVAVDGAHPLNLDVLTRAEAHALLARRLGTARVEAEPQAVEEIIDRCARLPLALAITAARAATRPAFSLASMAAELGDSAAVLDAFQDHGDTAADARAVFSWSYDALTPEAARLFRLLALHPGPDITLPATASLIARTAPDTRRLLAELVQAHLLDENTPGRYASHDLLRTYAGELTGTTDPAEQRHTARHRMLDHYLHTAHQGTALISLARTLIPLAPVTEGVQAEDLAADKAKAMAWFTAEEAVLLGAFKQSAAHEYDTYTWQLAWAVSHHLHLRGLWQEAEEMHLTALRAARRLDDRTAQARVVHGVVTATWGLGRQAEARAHAEHAVDLFSETSDLRARAEGHFMLAWAAEGQGDTEIALAAAEQALEFHRACGDFGTADTRAQMAIASALNAVGWCLKQLGHLAKALDNCQQALALCLAVGDTTLAAHTWDSIGHTHHALEQYAEAASAFRSALALYQQQGELPWFRGGTLMRLGDTHLSDGDPDSARAVWTESLAIMERLGHADAESLRTRLKGLDEPAGPPAAGPEHTDA